MPKLQPSSLNQFQMGARAIEVSPRGESGLISFVVDFGLFLVSFGKSKLLSNCIPQSLKDVHCKIGKLDNAAAPFQKI